MAESIEMRIETDESWDRLFFALHRSAILGGSGRRALLLNMLDRLGTDAEGAIRTFAPVGSSGYLHRHIDKTGVRYHPGGYGGGGTYEVITGVKRGTSMHPLYVHEGTANIYSGGVLDLLAETDPGRFAGGATMQGRIYPRGDRAAASVISSRRPRARTNFYSQNDRSMRSVSRRPSLTFQKRGEPRKWRAWVSGQSPQPFIYWAWQTAIIYNPMLSRASLRGVARNLLPGLNLSPFGQNPPTGRGWINQ